MSLKDTLYLEGAFNQNCQEILEISIETYISIFTLVYCENSSLNVCFVKTNEILPCSIPYNSVKFLNCRFIVKESDITEKHVQNSYLPAIESADKYTYIGGLCAVLRWTVKSLISIYPSHPCQDLLGFRGGCLVACAESSIWTKFCEVELPLAAKNISVAVKEMKNVQSIPEDLVKLEAHLMQPVRTHNILKRKQDLAKKLKDKMNVGILSPTNSRNSQDEFNSAVKEESISPEIDFTLNSDNKSTQDSQLKTTQNLLEHIKITETSDNFHLEHCYMEGIDLTLADVILFPCVHYLLHNISTQATEFLPRVIRWYEKMFSNCKVKYAADSCGWIKWHNQSLSHTQLNSSSFMLPKTKLCSLYSRDPGRPRLKCRNYDPSGVISVLEGQGIQPQYEQKLFKDFAGLKWNTLPDALHPANGDLPKSRVDRKCQQLESIITAVIKLAIPGQTIVDFCAGGGHVGLLLAYYLPECHNYWRKVLYERDDTKIHCLLSLNGNHDVYYSERYKTNNIRIILVENKEASMCRARSRAHLLNLKNIVFFQCNLDYFKGFFDIGVSLHACGVATDLVMQKCLTCKAAFVCCPCCYGGIQDTHLLKYPLSKKFRDVGIIYEDFELLAHCADRTEINTPKVEQGKYCMGMIDMDRVFFAEENGFKILLSTLHPVSCSPKHNLLIGIPNCWSNHFELSFIT